MLGQTGKYSKVINLYPENFFFVPGNIFTLPIYFIVSPINILKAPNISRHSQILYIDVQIFVLLHRFLFSSPEIFWCSPEIVGHPQKLIYCLEKKHFSPNLLCHMPRFF